MAAEDVKNIDARVKAFFENIEKQLNKLKEQVDSDSFAKAISKQLSDITINLSLNEQSKLDFKKELKNIKLNTQMQLI